MVEFRIGLSKKFGAGKMLKAFFEEHTEYDGIFYIGYPILFSTIESKVVDALLVSPNFGIVVFDLVEGAKLDTDRSAAQDDLFIRVENLLRQYSELRAGRQLNVDIHTITFAPGAPREETDFSCAYNHDDLLHFFSSLPDWKFPELYNKTLSVIQSVTKLRGDSDRTYIEKEDSKGAKIRDLEATIATLDGDQEKAILEYFEGVQRIRGLAGSGKTIVLAIKAAYIHAINPEWKIAVTFNTRALKNQFIQLVERFVVEKKGQLPNWKNIKIIQAWGSPSSEGIYYNICKEYGIEYFDFKRAESHKVSTGQFGRVAFEIICEKALQEIPKNKWKGEYDLILVDEAQDLSQYFLQLCFNILTDKKRLVYAYDELQKLYEGSPLRSPKEIFGVQKYADEILETCYRNSRPVLTTAHALGFGIYRNRPEHVKLVQFFDNPKLWNDVGYQVIEGEMTANSMVKLARTPKSSPKYLEEYLGKDSTDIISFHVCKDRDDQAEKVSKHIIDNLLKDELLHKDIIVINPEAVTTKDEVAIIRSLLYQKRINSHIAGEFNSDVFFQENSITFSGINRAKGNEVPMVYIINAQYCFEGRELRKKRNILFTAITRSKAWVKIFGMGPAMSGLKEEFERVRDNNFTLQFLYPTKEQIEKMNLINRDLSNDEKQTIKRDIDALTEIIQRVKEGKNQIEDYPEDIQKMLKVLIK
jgi:superfamily I DNA and RNA helicase